VPSRGINIRGVKLRGRMLETGVAYKPELGGRFIELRSCHVIAEDITRPSETNGLGSNFKFVCNNFLVAIITRKQHHPVFAERHPLIIVISSEMFDVDDRHFPSCSA
jgi:hypothetical protein